MFQCNFVFFLKPDVSICIAVPYAAAMPGMLYQYPMPAPLYGGPPVMYPSMTMLQPATALLQAPGSQSGIPMSSSCKQVNKVTTLSFCSDFHTYQLMNL